ncbi:MAG: bifunctional UDP-N-acetylglucosamine diphosphorylase/glucosamine-1-phosphate N-acetyltransferase GlmU [Acidimicrobiia bacterium]|nr:MAG: bifunctional UDP-N-acetylglucosamine diphosphorylase/glucosamine-1-phosphate N-acetyltransferase GlmU [Acidimicrobiia bacterium]
MSTRVIVLAAGKGVRMRSSTPKVLHVAAGMTLLEWVLAAVSHLDPAETTVVVGHKADEIRSVLPDGTLSPLQDPQHGTGHAARVGLDSLSGMSGPIVVVPGDMPLITGEALKSLVAHHTSTGATATVMSVEVADPFGYGRVVRDGESVIGIIEEADASDSEKAITEVNTSVYVFDGSDLDAALDQITTDNAQEEYYLTDVIGILARAGKSVAALRVPAEMGSGVNTNTQLAMVAEVLRHRINLELLESGVWMLDPQRVYIDASVTVEPSARLYPEVYLTGSTTVGARAAVGPNVQASDSAIGNDAVVKQAVMFEATVGDGALVGPFAYLRPGAVLADGAKVGTYVEVKRSTIGRGSKVPHLSYIGDAQIGEDTNIGAGTVTVNYDGYEKFPTHIGNRVRIGSDTMLIAPVSIGDDAVTGAGSVIVNDVPDGALGVSRDPQRNVDGYAERRRKQAEEEQS